MEEINCFGIKRNRPVREEQAEGEEYPLMSDTLGRYKMGEFNGRPLMVTAPVTGELVANRRIVTSYDFASGTFGHASMIIGPFQSALDPALKELAKARKHYAEEMQKAREGKPYDKRLICGPVATESTHIYFAKDEDDEGESGENTKKASVGKRPS